MSSASLSYTYLPTSIGPLLLAGDKHNLKGIYFENNAFNPPPDWQRVEALPYPIAEQLDAYFTGALREFDLPLAPEGTTFQLEVWAALEEIPYGETISYAELALRIGNPAAVRAVGMANGKNPLPIVVPCHRVIGSDGSLTGFGGGLPTKEFLLKLEGVPVPEHDQQLSLF
ncbi:MAG: methylated-DNA-[protein]-cysteine S-methyltransferase [Candidatus Latescibacterota bacterium]|jgi:methylated-DNA-[protein]-cysteine S-methyltransferase